CGARRRAMARAHQRPRPSGARRAGAFPRPRDRPPRRWLSRHLRRSGPSDSMRTVDRRARPRAWNPGQGRASHRRARPARVRNRRNRGAHRRARDEPRRPGRGARHQHGARPRCGLRTFFLGSRPPRAEGRPRLVADPAGRARGGMTGSKEHFDEVAAQEPLLRRVPYLRNLDRVDIARLIGASQDAHFTAGATIVREGEQADSLYLLASGTVEMVVTAGAGERSLRTVSAPAAFGEFGLLLAQRTATVRALTDVQAWRIPRDHFERLLRERPALGLAMARALAGLIDERDRERVGAPRPEPAPARSMSAPMPHRSTLVRVASICAAVAVPAALWFVPAPAGLTDQGWRIALIVLGGAIAWLLEPVPDFAVALGMAAAWGATGLAPVALAFGGFATSAWVVAVAAFAITAAMASSGLLFRTALILLRIFPSTHRGQLAALLLGGVLLTPVVPAVLGRVATVAPVARDVSRALGHERRSRSSAAIAFAGILGNTMLGPVFLTGVITNFLILGLLPAAHVSRFGWFGWLAAAAPAGAVILIGSAITVLALDRSSASRASSAVRQTQERTLGPLSRQERVAAAALGVFV